MDISSPLLPAVLGGLLIGLAATLLYAFQGRIAGISGIGYGLLWGTSNDRGWRLAFIAGLIGGGWLALAAGMPLPRMPLPEAGTEIALLIVAGLLVGYGTRMGNGCTSGHGVCGIARLSPRSIIAVLCFMATGFAAATLLRPLWL